jgi:hypothetical protein
VLLWFLLACIFIVLVVLGFIGDEEPDNGLYQEQDDAQNTDGRLSVSLRIAPVTTL